MKNMKRTPEGANHQHAPAFRSRARHKRRGYNEIIRLTLTAWLLVAPIGIIWLYLITRDATIVLIWTSCIGLIAIVFAYFFKDR
jgi:hypothetical protein